MSEPRIIWTDSQGDRRVVVVEDYPSAEWLCDGQWLHLDSDPIAWDDGGDEVDEEKERFVIAMALEELRDEVDRLKGSLLSARAAKRREATS